MDLGGNALPPGTGRDPLNHVPTPRVELQHLHGAQQLSSPASVLDAFALSEVLEFLQADRVLILDEQIPGTSEVVVGVKRDPRAQLSRPLPAVKPLLQGLDLPLPVMILPVDVDDLVDEDRPASGHPHQLVKGVVLAEEEFDVLSLGPGPQAGLGPPDYA